jgi:tetratricopeptide (TPR) repeat protein
MLADRLKKVVTADPSNARAHLRLAAVCLRQFELEQQSAENPMALHQIRDAAVASRFPSREALDEWLSRAIGENREFLYQALGHCHTALELCPLQGDGYVYLGELIFLEQPVSDSRLAHIEQAQKVRPHSALVHYTAGREAALKGDMATAVQHWRKALKTDPQFQSQILETLAPSVPVDYLLDTFDPDADGVAQLYRYYLAVGRLDEARQAARRYLQEMQAVINTRAPAEAAELWHEARHIFQFLGEDERALTCQRKAVALAPHDINKRKILAELLTRRGSYDEAMEQLRWCLHRLPHDESLRAQQADLERRQLADHNLSPRKMR